MIINNILIKLKHLFFKTKKFVIDLDKIQFLPNELISCLINEFSNNNTKNINYIGYCNTTGRELYFFLIEKEDNKIEFICLVNKHDYEYFVYHSNKNINEYILYEKFYFIPHSKNSTLNEKYNQADWLLHSDAELSDIDTKYTLTYEEIIKFYKNKITQQNIINF